MGTTYKIFHRDGKVGVIDKKKLPHEPGRCPQSETHCGLTDFEDLGEEWHCKCDESKSVYLKALEIALATKGIEVDLMKTDVFVIDRYTYGDKGLSHWILDKGGVRIFMQENTSYDLPSGFEVEISNRVDIEQVPEDERMRNKSGAYQIATILPIEKKEESQDELLQTVDANMPNFISLTNIGTLGF